MTALIAQFNKYLPQESWLSHHSEIHGLDHLSRVVQLQEMISDAQEKDGMVLDREGLRWASALHDIGRVDDGIDPDHGKRGGEWLRNNMVGTIPPDIFESVIYLVTWHNIEDRLIPQMTNEMAVLKDADALDRVRINDLDPARLRFDVSRGFIKTARQLLAVSVKGVELERADLAA